MNFQTSPVKPAGSRERSLDEVKAEFMRRAGRLNPFEDIRREDAERVMNALTSLDKDHWAQEWCKIGLGYEEKADARAKVGAAGAELAEIYMHAFDACRVGRYPTPNSPGKLEAYKHSLRMFRKAAKYFDPPLESRRAAVRWQDADRLFAAPARRDEAAGGYALGRRRRLEGRSPAHCQCDHGGRASPRSPSTCRAAARIPYSTAIRPAERTYGLARFSAAAHRPRRRRIASGAAASAPTGRRGSPYVAPDRIKGAVFHGGNIHYGFQKEWLVPAFTTGGATYLFGAHSLLEARGRAMGTKTMDEFLAIAPRFSLLTMGLLDKPSAPMLGVNGKLDDQAPVDDVYLLMEHGNPKSARIYPEGHHMGRTPGEPSEHITTTIVEWLRSQLAG